MREKIAMAFGSFDILHPGHIHYLERASRYGKLIVVVARDESIRMLKGRKPLFGEGSRLEVVGALRFVHKAVLGNRIKNPDGIYRILLKYRPDFIVLGYDQEIDELKLRRNLGKYGINAKIKREKPFSSDVFKSSRLRKMI
ncbi:MAG: adenylyltransferase/cytidyltransferase family protein [Candidatus Micrarchaeaceae archaeon]